MPEAIEFIETTDSFDEFVVDDSFALRFYEAAPLEKVCNACLISLPLTLKYFHCEPGWKYGFRATCKKCRKLGLKAAPKLEIKHKRCYKCDNIFEKNNDNFIPMKSSNGKYYFSRECRQCNNERQSKQYYNKSEEEKKISFEKNFKHDIKKKYGLTLGQYQSMNDEQDGLCAICKGLPIPGQILCIDHNHQTGKVRGLLCRKHNAAIGMLGDDPVLVKAALDYLLKHQDGEV